VSVIWHDLECGGYIEDLPLWRSLADEYGDPILDVGAGTGRVAVDLARAGHRVTALDRDPVLLAELSRRASGMDVTTVVADARRFELGSLYSLCVVPMQTIQLLGGAEGRTEFLRCARRHLHREGVLAVAISEELELYELVEGAPAPLPDIRELNGVLYWSQPTAVRASSDAFVLERRRERIGAGGDRTVEHDAVRLDRVGAEQLEAEARVAGLEPAGRATISETRDYSGSTVVMLRA
jgi:SAM-dependent methyltransferase